MRGLGTFVKSCATSCATVRGIVVAAAAVGLLALVVNLLLIPAYREATGFIPFDAQARLSHFMLGVELGAVDKGKAAHIYALFAAVDVLYAAATAWLFTVFWSWLFAMAPTRLFAFLTRGGILLVPFYVLILDVAAKVGFFRLVRGLDDPAYAATVDFSVMIHRLGFALRDLRNYLTVAFLLAIAIGFLLRRRRP